MKVILADKAKSDLFRIYSYIEQRSPLAAEKILARIDKKFDQLTCSPSSGANGPASPRVFAVPSSEHT